MSDMAAAGVHVIMLPYPPAGHSTPFIHFSKGLATLGVAITFIVPDSGLSRFQKQLTEDPTFKARSNIHLVPYEVPVAGLDPLHALKEWMYSKYDMFSDIVGGLMTDAAESPMMVQYPSRSEAGPPVCILSDMFLGFTQVESYFLLTIFVNLLKSQIRYSTISLGRHVKLELRPPDSVCTSRVCCNVPLNYNSEEFN